MGPIGDWETKKVTGGMFLQSGYYTYLNDKGQKETKLRGTRKGQVLAPGEESVVGDIREFLINEVLKAWCEPKLPTTFSIRKHGRPLISSGMLISPPALPSRRRRVGGLPGVG